MSGYSHNYLKFLSTIVFMLLITFIIGCSSDDIIDEVADGGSETGNPGSDIILSGYAQKGPFGFGTDIYIQSLENFVPVKLLVILETDEFGNYTSSNIENPGDYIELRATGWYFDEISGSMSEGELDLIAWSDVQADDSININVLTTMAKERVANLIGTGMGFAEASEQARAELLDIFDIDDLTDTHFEDMNMMQDGDANGILLAVSAILMQAAHDVSGGVSITYELEELLRQIHNDIRTDGLLDDVDLNTYIENATMIIDTTAVRTNMETQFSAYVIPPFEQYILGDLNITWTGFDCAANGVATVETEINNGLTGSISDGPWPCGEAQGTVNGLNAGTYDLVTVNFLDETGDLVARTETANVTIIAGQTNTLNITPGSFVTGGVSVEWDTDCSSNNIDTIQAIVYDSLGAEIQTAGPWDCDDDNRTIGDIPDLTDGSVVLVYSDHNDNEICRAELTDIDVVSGETTDIGPLEIVPPEITQPLSGTTFREGDTITFAGTGSDLQGNPLSGAYLVWTSDIDNEIGIGETFNFSGLSYGMHTITLAAVDNTLGNISTSIIVHIRTAGTTIYVGPGEVYTTIQAAVTGANADDRIIVQDGTYNENVDVDKELTIESENGYSSTIVVAAVTDDHVFYVTADHVTIEGFTVYNHPDTGSMGICLYGAENCLITNNRCGIDIDNRNYRGISVSNGGNNIISNNHCYSNRQSGITISSANNTISGNTCDANFSGILIGSTDNQVLNNTVTNSDNGVHLNGASQTIVSGNTCTSNNYRTISRGITIYNSDDNTISNNVSNSNPFGIYLFNASNNNNVLNNTCNSNTNSGINLSSPADNNTISGNTCNSNTNRGIISGSLNNTISDNTCLLNVTGISVGASNHTVSGNTCSENQTGLIIGSSGNTVTENTFTSNTTQGLNITFSNNTLYLNNFDNSTNINSGSGITNAWNSSTQITYTYNGSGYTGFLGNYYADHDLTDTNGDGVTDNPYDLPDDEPDDAYPLADTTDNFTY